MISIPKIEALQFRQLSFSYAGQAQLLQQVDFDFPMNELIWVRAEHGSGRSSLLQLMAGIIFAEGGYYLINGQNLNEMSFEEFLPYRLAFGYGFDYGGLINNRSLLENLTLPLLYHKICPASEANEIVRKLMQDFGLQKYADKRPAVVQGAVRKLVILLRALVMDPQVLILDDPSVGLNEEIVNKYFSLVEQHRKQKSLRHIFMSSFDSRLMSTLAHNEIHLQDCGLSAHTSGVRTA